MSNSKRRARPRHHQSAKPYPAFPLTAHPTGRWCKKVLGKIHFFGKLDDWKAALEKWEREEPDLRAGRPPRPAGPAGYTLRNLTVAYLNHKKARMESGAAVPRLFDGREPASHAKNRRRRSSRGFSAAAYARCRQGELE